MKTLLKHVLARAGFALHRLPKGVPTGNDLQHDLTLILGNRKSLCCIDAGANDGSTISLLRRCLQMPTIHAFEPNPTTFASLQTNHSGLPDVHLVNAGLGDTTGALALNRVANHALNSFLPFTPNGRKRLDVSDAAQVVSVPVMRLDEYAAQQHLTSIDLLKIDTQGFELRVLRGAEQLFAQSAVRAVLLELNFADLYVGQAAPAEVFGWLDARNLRLVDFYEKCRHGALLGWCTALFLRATPTPVR